LRIYIRTLLLSIELLKILEIKAKEILQMVRDFGALVGAAHVDNPGVALEGSGGLLLLGLIIMSLSIISMLIFSCADGIFRNRHGGGHGGTGGGDLGGGGGACGGC